MNNISTFEWYSNLIKPAWALPAWLFGPVWTVLYVLIFVSYGYVFYLFLKNKINFLTLFPFLLNLFFNFIFTPIQFGLQNNLLASIDIFLVLVTLIWSLISIYSYARWVFYVNTPYFLWVLFATYLQFTITYLNY